MRSLEPFGKAPNHNGLTKALRALMQCVRAVDCDSSCTCGCACSEARQQEQSESVAVGGSRRFENASASLRISIQIPHRGCIEISIALRKRGPVLCPIKPSVFPSLAHRLCVCTSNDVQAFVSVRLGRMVGPWSLILCLTPHAHKTSDGIRHRESILRDLREFLLV